MLNSIAIALSTLSGQAWTADGETLSNGEITLQCDRFLRGMAPNSAQANKHLISLAAAIKGHELRPYVLKHVAEAQTYQVIRFAQPVEAIAREILELCDRVTPAYLDAEGDYLRSELESLLN